jgi:hypothetical protein
MAPKHEPTDPSRRRVIKGAALSQTAEETPATRSYAFLQPKEGALRLGRDGAADPG